MKDKFLVGNIVVFFISILLGLCFSTISAPYNPVRKSPLTEHTVELRNSDKLYQEFKGENVFGIHLGILSDYENNTEGKIKISLSNKNNCSEKYIDLHNLRNKNWQTIKIPFSKEEIQEISDKHFKLAIELLDLGDKDKIIVLLNDNPQKYKTYPVVINNKIIQGSTLQFSYSFFNYKSFTLFSLISFFLIIFFKSLYRSNKVRTFIRDNNILSVYLLLVIIFLAKNYHRIKDFGNGWINAPYFVNYFDAGFVSKGLPGTVLRLFTDQISAHVLLYTFTFIALISFILIGWIINFIVKNISPNYKKTIGLLLVFYLFFPMNVLGYFLHFGRVDLILLICFLFSLIMLKSQNKLCMYSIAFFSIVAILCHQIYVFTYYPFIFLLISFFTLKDWKRNWKIFLFNIIAPAIFTIKIQFFGVPNLGFSELQAIINSHTFTPILEAALFCDHYMPVLENIYVFGFLDRQLGHNLQYLVLALLWLFPYILILLELAKKIYKKSLHKKLFILALVIPFISVLPMFVSISDWGRIILELFNGLFFTLLLLFVLLPNLWLSAFDEVITGIYNRMGKASLVLLVYPFLLGDVYPGIIFPSVSGNIVEWINNFAIRVFNNF